MVRVWRPDDDEERPDGLRGTAVHLSSGASLTFTETTALLTFLAETHSTSESRATTSFAAGDSE